MKVSWGLSLLLCVACTNSGPKASHGEPLSERQLSEYANSSDDWSRLKWINKAASKLRMGVGLSTSDDIPDLLKKTDQQVVDLFMSAPEFQDAVLDFHRFFLGLQTATLRDGTGSISSQVLLDGLPMQLTQSVINGGDFYKAFEFSHPLYLPNFEKTPSRNKSEEMLGDKERREIRLSEVESTFAELKSEVERDTNITPEKFCIKARPHFVTWFRIGLPELTVKAIVEAEGWNRLSYLSCANLQFEEFDAKKAIREMENYNQTVLEQLHQLNQAQYSPTNVSDIKALKFGSLPSPFHAMGGTLKTRLLNSSTNFNRKRAAFILDRFLCDDLTPIAVDAPADPSRAHGLQNPCYACHYKLDPMAGFFRNYGGGFRPYAEGSRIVFDDSAKTDLNRYVSVWRSKDDSREWDVGYIRSASNEEINSYGSTPGDLFEILGKSEEFRSCYIRRLFDYYIDPRQTVDLSYLADLSKQLKPGSESGTAVLSVIKALVLNNSFRKENPDLGTCYDFGENFENSKVPCRVSGILQKNCASCHNASSRFGNLDVTTWVE